MASKQLQDARKQTNDGFRSNQQAHCPIIRRSSKAGRIKSSKKKPETALASLDQLQVTVDSIAMYAMTQLNEVNKQLIDLKRKPS